MNQAANILQSLRNLARLEADLPALAGDSPEYDEQKGKIERERAPLPTSILSHYDRRIARGQIGIAPVHGTACGACYLTLPSGRLADMRRKPRELNVCDHCGAFIYLAEDRVPSSAKPTHPPVAKRSKTKRSNARAKQ